MKVAPKSVGSFLTHPTQPYMGALFYGPDQGLARERAQQVIQQLLGTTPDPMALLDVTEARLLSEPTLLLDELSSIAWMVSQRVLLIRDAGDKLTKLLESASEHVRADYYLIILAEELGPRSSLRLYCEKATHIASVACYHDEARDIGDLLRDAFKLAQIHVDPDVIPYLINQLGNDRYVTRQEIEKILTYLGEEKHLSLEIAETLVSYNQEADIDAAVHALADRKLAALDHAITQLLKQQVQPIVYLRAAGRYFQRLYSIRLQAETSSIESVIAGLRPPVFFKQLPILTRHAKQWRCADIATALGYIHAAELAVKSSDLPILAASERELFKAARSNSGK